MIPLKLKLRNFMCYRGDIEPLDFEGIHLAVLTGDNGHGKSALLDAMTWALWGKSRARHDDDLVSLGETEMAVQFDFLLGNNHYRVVRKRDKAKGGHSSLEFQVRANGHFRSISEATLRATQERITSTLRMDYDTFINSAFLVQGRADEFTLRPPAERKRVLAEILGLGLYDVYEERAKERARACLEQERQFEALIESTDRELAKRPQYEEELTRAEAEVASLNAKVKEGESVLSEIRERVQELELKRMQLSELEKRLAEGERSLREAQQAVAEHEERVIAYETALARREEIEAGYATWHRARQVDEDMGRKLSQLVALNEEKNRLERVIAEARNRLEIEQRLLAEKKAALEQQEAALPELEIGLAEAQAEVARLEALNVEREGLLRRIQELNSEVVALKAANTQLKEEMQSLKERLELLEVAKAKCPLCGQDLAEQDRIRLVDEFKTEGKQKGGLYRENLARLQELGEQTETLKDRVAEIEHALRDQAVAQGRAAMAQKAVDDAKAAVRELVGIRATLAALGERLAAGDYAMEEQARLAQVMAQVAAVGYDATVHERARQQREEYAPFETLQAELEAAIRLLETERVALENARRRVERETEIMAAERARADELRAALAEQPQVVSRLQAETETLEGLRTQEAKARLALGAAQQKLDYADHLEKEREKYLQERQRVAKERSIYEELRSAFSKRGLQAVIIESALPEIEDEANALLSRMTEGRMSVRLETQREAKTGDTPIETLDIIISDEYGPRGYEMYSGGEAFRVDFAIRIALSRLLARRAGAQLQTLIIDEGFGSQDAQGRERLVEAIKSIEQDFARILVVTHIDELKDAFPVRIDVFKTPAGSRFSIN